MVGSGAEKCFTPRLVHSQKGLYADSGRDGSKFRGLEEGENQSVAGKNSLANHL